MRLATRISLWIVRLAGITALVLGTLFWTGRSVNLVPLHILIGFLMVLALWTIAILALVARAGGGLAVFAILWGIALPALGVPQATIMVGSQHWIVRVIHLIMGLTAIALADRLARRIMAAPARPGKAVDLSTATLRRGA